MQALGIIKVYGAIIIPIQNSAQALYMKPCHTQNPCLLRIQDIFKNLSNMWIDHAYSEPRHGPNSLFKHFQGYLGIFWNIAAISPTTDTDAQLVGRVETEKSILMLEIKVMIVSNFGLNLIVPRCVFGKIFIEML